MLKHVYLVDKIAVETAENEPSKVLQLSLIFIRPRDSVPPAPPALGAVWLGGDSLIPLLASEVGYFLEIKTLMDTVKPLSVKI